MPIVLEPERAPERRARIVGLDHGVELDRAKASASWPTRSRARPAPGPTPRPARAEVDHEARAGDVVTRTLAVRVGVGAADDPAVAARRRTSPRAGSTIQSSRAAASLRSGSYGIGLARRRRSRGRTARSRASRRPSPRGLIDRQSFFAPARLHPLRLALLLAEVRRPRGVAEALGLVAVGELEQRVERVVDVVDRRRGVAALGEPRRAPCRGAARPGRRRAPRPTRAGSRRGRRASGAPTRPRRRCGRGRSGCSRRRRRGAPPSTTSRSPARSARSTSRASASAARRTSVNVHFGSIRTLTWIPREPEVFGKPSRPWSASTSRTHHRHLAHLVEARLRRRVEVDAQLVGMVEVGAPRRPRVEVDHPEVDRPDQVRGVVGDRARWRCARSGTSRSRSRSSRAPSSAPASGRRTRPRRRRRSASSSSGARAGAGRRRRRPRRSTRRGRAWCARASGKKTLLGLESRTSRPAASISIASLAIGAHLSKPARRRP